MIGKSSILAVCALAAFAAAPLPTMSVAFAACEFGERVDNTTADQAARRLRAAGYSDVRDLKKGCDSFWHASATKDGKRVNVAVSPQGEVLPEGE